MNFFKKIWHRRREQKPRPLRIEGVKTTLTPAPDDGELAAQALLESLIYGDKATRRKVINRKARKPAGPGDRHDADYYRQLSDRIRDARQEEARLATRYVAFCEQELHSGGTPPAELEGGLYRHLDTVEREDGDLKRRWQHCLAECIVRKTNAPIEREEGRPQVTATEDMGKKD